jgi:hypothetical protein
MEVFIRFRADVADLQELHVGNCRACLATEADDMRKWFSIAAVLLLAGCSKTKTSEPLTGVATGANPEPVARAIESAPPRAQVVVPNGTSLHVRVDSSIDTRRNRAGDHFSATLAEPIEVEGRTVVPAGTEFTGHVTNAGASGRLKGRAALGLKLDAFRLNGREYPIQTTSVDRVSAAHKKRNSILIGGGTGLGAALGAIAGGPKGALIGAGAGAAAGTAGAAVTGKRQLEIRAETPLRFTLRAAVEM